MFLKYMLILVFLRHHHGNHTVGYCASYFVFFMNKYVNIYFFYCKHRLQHLPGALPRERKRNENQFLIWMWVISLRDFLEIKQSLIPGATIVNHIFNLLCQCHVALTPYFRQLGGMWGIVMPKLCTHTYSSSTISTAASLSPALSSAS